MSMYPNIFLVREKGVFSIISCPKMIWTGVSCNVMCYIVCTEKSVDSIINYQGKSSLR